MARLVLERQQAQRSVSRRQPQRGLHMAYWSDFHSDPRTSYYLFLRQGYACPAHVAHARVKRVDAMVASLGGSRREAAAIAGLSALTQLLGVASHLRSAVHRLRESLFSSNEAGSAKA
jgi:hypothetical protein